MVDRFKTMVCLTLSFSMITSLAGCVKESDNDNIQTTAVQTTQEETVQTSLATADTAAPETKKITLNYNRIKQNSDKIKKDFDNLITRKRFKGVVYTKIGNDFEYIGSNGFSNQDSHKKNSLNTNYYAGPVTQQLTAAAILLLQEDEKLTTSDKLEKYYPDYKYGDKITIKNLLTMTAGLPDCYYKGTSTEKGSVYRLSELPYDVFEEADADDNRRSVLNWILSQDTVFTPGEKFAYSNSSYYVLGDIIEKVSGMSYETYVTENILDPLGMTSSGFKATDSLATGYQDIYENNWILYPGVAYSASGLITNVPDIIKWVGAVTGDDFLTEKSRNEMFASLNSNYSYGVFADDKNYQAGGSFYRFSSFLYYNADMSNVFIAFSNYTQSDPKEIYNEYSNILKPFYG